MALPIRTTQARPAMSLEQNAAIAIDGAGPDGVDASQDVPVARARVGDVVEIVAQDETLVFDINAYVSAPGVVTVQIVDPTGTGGTGTLIVDIAVFHRN